MKKSKSKFMIFLVALVIILFAILFVTSIIQMFKKVPNITIPSTIPSEGFHVPNRALLHNDLIGYFRGRKLVLYEDHMEYRSNSFFKSYSRSWDEIELVSTIPADSVYGSNKSYTSNGLKIHFKGDSSFVKSQFLDFYPDFGNRENRLQVLIFLQKKNVPLSPDLVAQIKE